MTRSLAKDLEIVLGLLGDVDRKLDVLHQRVPLPPVPPEPPPKPQT